MANKERHRGIPRTDTERAMSHYGITEEEYLAHPDWYPLPPRGSGFEEGRAAIGGGGTDTNVGGVGIAILAIAALVVGYLLTRKVD